MNSKEFLKKLNKQIDGCWIWTGARKPSGYGNLVLDGTHTTAHRASWEIHRGPIPNGMHVCHTCDIPSCANPNHLFLGSRSDNVQDMMNKGRCGRGQAKLNWKSVGEIRALRLAGLKLREIGAKYSVTEGTISYICTGKIWCKP